MHHNRVPYLKHILLVKLFQELISLLRFKRCNKWLFDVLATIRSIQHQCRIDVKVLCDSCIVHLNCQWFYRQHIRHIGTIHSISTIGTTSSLSDCLDHFHNISVCRHLSTSSLNDVSSISLSSIRFSKASVRSI